MFRKLLRKIGLKGGQAAIVDAIAQEVLDKATHGASERVEDIIKDKPVRRRKH